MMKNKYRVVKWEQSDSFYFVQQAVFRFNKGLQQHAWEWVNLEVFTDQDLAEEFCLCKYFEHRDGQLEVIYEVGE